MDRERAKTVLQRIVEDTRHQLTDYAATNNLVIDITNVQDQDIVRSIIRSAGFDDTDFEDQVILEISNILNLSL